MAFKLSKTSLEKLNGVHPDLVRIVRRALEICHTDFSVSEGLRSQERQKQLYADGFTQTLKSKHLKQADGWGHAVDLYPYPVDMQKVNKGSAVEIVRFGVIAGAMFAAAKELGREIIWGADWNNNGQTLDHSFFDAPHFELRG